MQFQSVSPCATAFACGLKACSSIRAFDKGLDIHAKIVKKGLEGDTTIGKSLVEMYVRCGLLAEAHLLIQTHSEQNVSSWNTLIAGNVEHGHDEEALRALQEMRSVDICVDAVTFVWSFKACGSLSAAEEGRKVHAESVRKGLETDLRVSSALVNMYAKCGLLSEAQGLFDKLSLQTYVSGTALLAGYSDCGYDEEALSLFNHLQKKSIFIDSIMLACALKACGSLGMKNIGLQIHSEAELKGFLETNGYLSIGLLDMYMKFGLLAEARNMFEQLPIQDVDLWTSLIVGYVEQGCSKEVLECLQQICREDVSPNAFTLVCCLQACTHAGSRARGRGLHAEIACKGWETEIFVGNTLINMYAKWGFVDEAWNVFNKLSVKNAIAWTALMTAYIDLGYSQEAFLCLEQMQDQRISPDAVTFVCSLVACGSIGASRKCQELHTDIVKKGYDKDGLIGNTLVGTYGRCGFLDAAEAAFMTLQEPEIVSWNALIAAYSELRESEDVFHVFYSMVSKGIMPDEVTFVSILNACNHAGLLDKGQIIFVVISHAYGVIPTDEHFTCLTDMYGRAGNIDLAITLIERLPFHPGSVVWHTIQAACQRRGHVALARQAFECVAGLNLKNASAYISMANVLSNFTSMEEEEGLRA